MARRRGDLPFDRDASGRFLPWLIAFMVFLAGLALAGALGLERLAGDWNRGVSATFTVQIPAAATREETARRVSQALRHLGEVDGIAEARELDDADLARLIGPWLGSSNDLDDLPLPRLIDLRLLPAATVTAADLQNHLDSRIPGVLVDDHQVWLSRLVALLRTVEAVALSVVALTLVAMIATVVFATRAGLAVHHDVIELLHLTGARDSYIAWQFAIRALMLGLRGGALGLLLCLPALLGLSAMIDGLGGDVAPSFGPSALDVAILALLPGLAGVSAMIAARRTVMRALRRMF